MGRKKSDYIVVVTLIFIALKSLCCNGFRSSTEMNKSTVGHVFKTLHNIDWLSCVAECSRSSECFSYNFQNYLIRTKCELNNDRTEGQCGPSLSLIHTRSSFFQLLKPPPQSDRSASVVHLPPKVLMKIRRKLSQTTIECQVTAHVAGPSITWYKDGRIIEPHVTHTNSDVTLSRLTVTSGRDYSGNYTYVVITKYGKASSYVLLHGPSEYPNATAVYALDGESGLRDISGNHNPRGVGGKTVPLAPGPHGGVNASYKFMDTPTDYIEFPNNGGLDTRTSTTLLIWVYIESIGVTSSLISYVSRNGSMQTWGVSLLVYNYVPTLVLAIRGSDRKAEEVKNSEVNLIRHTWHYIGASYNYSSGVGSLWVNGKIVMRKDVGRFELDTTRNVLIEPFQGRVSCLQIYSEALSSNMINQLKNRCSGVHLYDAA